MSKIQNPCRSGTLISRDKEKEIRSLFQQVVDGVPISKKDAERILKYLNQKLKPIKPRSAKNKGARLQKLVCEMISKFTGIPWGSGDDFEIRSREMGLNGVDVVLRGKAREAFPFSIECKNTESFSLAATIKQAMDNTKEGDDWLIVHNSSKLEKPIVILDMEAFFRHYFKEK
jgi:hypothetical protein